MAVEKIINIDGKDVKFKASAAIPRIYRLKYGRDIFKDLVSLKDNIDENDENLSNLDIKSLEIFENIAYIMAKHADKNLDEDIDTWLENFNTFSIYQVLPKIIELWGMNVKTDIQTKKK